MQKGIWARTNRFMCLVVGVFFVLSLSLSVQAGVKKKVSSASVSSDQSWAALYIWDAFTPLVLDKSIPEMLISLEVIFQQHVNYMAKYELKLIDRKHGKRSTEGHYMMWIHLGKNLEHRLQEKLEELRQVLGDDKFIYASRNSDLFIAWGGEANFRDFILDGVIGLTRPVVLPSGKLTGDLQGLSVALGQGNPDYAGGWFTSEEQTEKMLNAIMKYPGLTKGYSFLSPTSERPNAPYETPSARAGNGYNCGDFAMYMLTEGGVLEKDLVESWKVSFWYPEKYWDHTIPLAGSGKKVFKKFSQDRSLYMSREQLLGIGWAQFLFSGLDVFDEKALVKEIHKDWPVVHPVRVWDQENVMNQLSRGAAQFEAKSVIEELGLARAGRLELDSPYPENKAALNFRTSERNGRYQKGAEKRRLSKLKKVDLQRPSDLTEYRKFEHSLRVP
jgi:hypothetical protein